MADPVIPTLWNDCIPWSGNLNQKGYARVRVKGRMQFLHRVMFGMTYGYLPPVVMHMCDNRACIKPSHLKAGTYAANNADRVAKGRSFKKLSDEDIQAILKIGRSQSYAKTAKQFECDPSRVYQIIKFGGRYVHTR